MEEVIKKDYELAVLLNDEVAESEIDNLLKNLPESKVDVFDKEKSKMVHLAYPIKKHESALLLIYKFKAEPEAVSQIKDILRFHKNVLRDMIITPPIQRQVISKKPKAEVSVKQSSTNKGPEISSNEVLTKTLEALEDSNESK